ncbi:uncharacterized protein LOC143208727 [Lasioglossum baleicum]|uniref:uncharacterized protein LOC143208727 n=1 Tax=Lasioglossum baleicum TaxID=434251 RepID=UPI003FCCE686
MIAIDNETLIVHLLSGAGTTNTIATQTAQSDRAYHRTQPAEPLTYRLRANTTLGAASRPRQADSAGHLCTKWREYHLQGARAQGLPAGLGFSLFLRGQHGITLMWPISASKCFD